MLRKLSILGLCLVIILVSFVGCDGPRPWEGRLPTLTPTATGVGGEVPRQTPTPSPTPVIEVVVTADGKLISLRPTLGLSFQVTGRVMEVLVRPGDTVKAGQLLARLDTLELENAVRDATAQLEQSRFELERVNRSTESGLELAAAWKAVEAAKLGVVNAQGFYSSTLLRSDVSADVREAKAWADFWGSELGDAWLRLDEKPDSDKRLWEYEKAGAQSERAHNRWLQIEQDAENQISGAERSLASARQTYLQALANYNSLKYSDPVRQAELQVMLNETTLTRAQMNLDRAELKAPWDAMVASVDIAPGSQVGGAPVVTLVDITNLQFVTDNLSERDLGRIEIGQEANITLKAFSDVPITGTVATIAPLAGPAVGDAATFAVHIDLGPPGDLALRPGMTGEVRIVVK